MVSLWHCLLSVVLVEHDIGMGDGRLMLCSTTGCGQALQQWPRLPSRHQGQFLRLHRLPRRSFRLEAPGRRQGWPHGHLCLRGLRCVPLGLPVHGPRFHLSPPQAGHAGCDDVLLEQPVYLHIHQCGLFQGRNQLADHLSGRSDAVDLIVSSCCAWRIRVEIAHGLGLFSILLRRCWMWKL